MRRIIYIGFWIFGLGGLGGCVSRLDESTLIGSVRDGSVPDGGTPMVCETFSEYDVGQQPPAWNDAYGKWQVAQEDDGSHALQQVTMPTSRNEFITWTGSPSWRDIQVSAAIDHGGQDSNDCVLARYSSPSMYYAVCITPSQNQGGGPPGWGLFMEGDGGRNQLMGGMLSMSSTGVHTIGMQITGSLITPIIDGSSKQPVNNSAYDDGAIGLSTEAQRADFSQICVNAQ